MSNWSPRWDGREAGQSLCMRGEYEYVHWYCVQCWLIKHGNFVCEICLQPYKSGYNTLEWLRRALEKMEESTRSLLNHH